MKRELILLIVMLLTFMLIAKEPVTISGSGLANDPGSRDPWDLLMQFNIDEQPGAFDLCGMEWDGEFFYAAMWGMMPAILRFDAEGNYIDSYFMPIIGAMDLAFDGEYMYGSYNSNTIFCWEAESGNLVPENDITVTGFNPYALAYDPLTDSFWGSSWYDSITNFDREGNILATFPNPGNMCIFGLAIDAEDPEGTMLYASYGEPGCFIAKINISTGTLLETVDITEYGGDEAMSGGLCCMNDWDPVYRTLGVLIRGYPVYICVIELGENAPAEAPSAPEMFTVTPDENGNLSAELSWLNPSETVAGETLTDLDEMRIYRDDELVHTITGPVIGGMETWTDVLPESGLYEYMVVGYNDAGEGLPAEVTIYVGEDVPAAVSSFMLINNEGTAVLSWANPIAGLHGGVYNEPITGYHLFRSDGEIFELMGILTAYDDYPLPEEGFYSYTIQPYNSAGDGGMASTASTWIGQGLGVYIGNPNTTLTSYQLPFNYYYKNSLSETIYYAEEFEAQGLNGGALTGLVYFSNFVSDLSDMPVNIWVGETDLEDFSDGWLAAGELTQVFDGTLNFPSGPQDIYVEFNQPYIYNGGNLVIMTERVMDTQYYSSLDVFRVSDTPGYANRTIYAYSDIEDFDPYNPSPVQHLTSLVPNTEFLVSINGMGALEGYAYNGNTNEPLYNVHIVLWEERLDTFTDANGHYIFPGLFDGTYEAHATLFGYSEDIQTIEIVADETTEQDFYLVPAPQVEVTGRVVGSDYPEVGLAGAEVTFSGMGIHSGLTDDDGYFLIDTVYSSNTYQMVVDAEGYEILVGEAVIGEGNTDLGDITVNEIAYPCYDVIATQNVEDTVIDLIWHSPNPGAGNFWDFEDDDGEFVANNGWAWGTDNIAGAYSGANVWGTVLNGYYNNSANYELVTPAVTVPTEDAVLTFWHWYDIETYWDGGNVKISSDGGSSWELIQPVGGYNGTAIGLNDEECFNGNFQTWTMATFELGAFQGEDVMIKFHFGSDFSVTYQGWYIDDVYIGIPETDVIDNANPHFHPVVSLLPAANDRLMENYNLYRLLWGEEENEETWETIAEGLIDTVYTDLSWENVTSEIYRYAVKAEYTNEVMAEAAFSNWVASDYYTSASFTVLDFFDNPVAEAQVRLLCQDADPEGVYYVYELLTDGNGYCNFPMIWKGNYNIRISKDNMETYAADMVEIFTPYELIVNMTEVLNPIAGLNYEVIDDDVTLWWSAPSDESFWDFEENNGEFSADMGWDWGTDNMAGAFSGSNVWGTVLDAPYALNANYQLVTPEISIPSDDAQLTFWHWYDIETWWDGGNVKISLDDGDTWSIIYPEGGYPEEACSPENAGIPNEPAFNGNTGWTQAVFEIGEFAGETAIFKFHFGSDYAVTYQGWYIDDVRVGAPEENFVRILEHYNVYRDGEILTNDLTELTYTDYDLSDGTYTYGVSAVYSTGESEIREEIVEIYPLSVGGYVTASDTPESEPFTGVQVSLENDEFSWSMETDASGEFSFAGVNGYQNYHLALSYEGYQMWTEELIVTDEDIYFDLITLIEIISAPGAVTATANAEDTEVDLIWQSPGQDVTYELSYDDGEAENVTSFDEDLSERAVWFTALGGPCSIIGGSINTYDGSFPWGVILTSFTAAVWSYDESSGLPGEMLASIQVNPNEFGWVEFEFEEPVEIDGTEFFLGYIQNSWYPECVPIAIDETPPLAMRSYEHWVLMGMPWMMSGYQDYMIRAIVEGPGGRSILGTEIPDMPLRHTKSSKGLHASVYVDQESVGQAHIEFEYNKNSQLNVFADASDEISRLDRELLGYNIYRGDYGDEVNYETWEQLNPVTNPDTTYNDLTWASVLSGLYRYAVRSVYTNDNLSGPSFSNWLGKDMYGQLTTTITTNVGMVPAGAIVSLECTEPDPDGIFPEYEGIADDAGVCVITGIWKSNYDIKIELFNFMTFEGNLDILEDEVIYNAMVTELSYPPRDVYIEENHSGNMWIIWHSPTGPLESFWDFEDDDGEFEGEIGWEWADNSNSGNPWSGENCWSMYPGSEYPINMNTSLYSPEVHIPSEETQLTFYHWYDFESWWDGGNVKISTDEGATWTIIHPEGDYPEPSVSPENAAIPGEPAYSGSMLQWSQAVFNLAEYEGEDVMFRFHAGSDYMINYLGWDIDDVRIGEPDERGRALPLITSKEINAFNIASQSSRDERPMEGYRIARGFEEDQENYENWELIAESVMDTTYEDMTWPNLTEPGNYMYYVQAMYTNNVLSEPYFSNVVPFEMYVPVSITVTTNGGDPSNGALVELFCTDGIHSYSGNISGGQIYWDEIWKGEYTLYIYLGMYETYTQENLWILDSTSLNVELIELICPPANVIVDESTGVFSWEDPIPPPSFRSNSSAVSKKDIQEQRDRHCDYFNVYFEDELIGPTFEHQVTLPECTYGETYTAGVSAHYSCNMESEIMEIEFTCLWTGISVNEIPLVTELSANYPNPFNPETAINYALAEQGTVTITIFNLRGQIINTLVNEIQEPGYYTVYWQGKDDKGRNVPSGIYFYTMKHGRYSTSKKMVLMK
ncbi:MAG: carboxypeptidase regulatory-like domain-containing protein [Candidatus Cloacimonetes bacterium]|nr:carboxypeptidase regulatory-like domain-containing protein [Candidatus Cloacimonadota bacterium]